jgi:transposase
MKAPYGKQVRKLALEYVFKYGRTKTAILQFHKVSGIAVSTIYSWIADQKKCGFIEVKIKRRLSRKCELKRHHLDLLVGELNSNPTAYQCEMTQLVFEEFGYVYSQSAISRFLKINKMTRKVLETHAKQQNYEQRALFRHVLRSDAEGGVFSARQFVFCDETHCDSKQVRRKYGYASKGQPAFNLNNNLHGSESISCIATLTIEGILSTTMHDRVNANIFLETLENDILPLMQPFPLPRSVLILDNASVHNKITVCNLCQQFGVIVLFLPPYSFELCFHIAKNYLRKHYPEDDANNPLHLKLHEALNNSITPEIAHNLFKHCYIDVNEDDISYVNR